MGPISYGKQEIQEDDIEAVIQALKSDFLTQGPLINLFEDNFAQYVGAKYAVAFANGTAALHGAAYALGVGPGQKILVPCMTFSASANCIRYCGGDVHFVDIDPRSFLIDLFKLKNILESHPKGTFQGVVPVDFAGYPVLMHELRKMADQYGLWILEDACHAPGAQYQDEKKQWHNVGSCKHSDVTAFSFHPVKHVASGEGGIITTNNKDLFEKLSLFRTHGINKDPSKFQDNPDGGWYYELHDLGFNYRLSEIHAALGITQLKKAPKKLERRREIAALYDESFKDLDLVTPKVQENVKHAYHLYIIESKKRNELYEFLRQKNIFAMVHYIPVHLLHYYRNLGWKKGDFPVGEEYYSRCLSLPMYPQLVEEEIQYVITAIKDFHS